MKVLANVNRIKNKNKNIYGLMFVSPFVIGIILIFIPILKDSFIYSLSEIKITTNGVNRLFVGWSNYNYALFVSPDFVKNVYSNIIKMLNNIPTLIMFSLFIAVILNSKLKGRVFFRAVFFLPVIISTGIIAKADNLTNLVKNISEMQGIDMGTGGNASHGLINLNEIDVLINNFIFAPQIAGLIKYSINNIYEVISKSGVQILIFLAGLQSIDKAVYEAAYIEGATGWESFWKLTFPMISPMIFVNVIYTIIDSLASSTNEIMILISNTAFKFSQYGIASAMSWIYFAVISICIIAIVSLINRFIYCRE